MATECLPQECEFVEVDWMNMSIEAVGSWDYGDWWVDVGVDDGGQRVDESQITTKGQ